MSEETEIRELQDAIRHKVIELSGAPDHAIDGAGSDAGYIEFTLCEIEQGFSWLRERHEAELDKAREELKKIRDDVALDNPLLANPASHTDVHNALMRMNEDEWKAFCDSLWITLPYQNDCVDYVKQILITPLPTLVSCFLTATKGRMK